jgi:glycosyltransferase involved in cell wall biosynthesis
MNEYLLIIPAFNEEKNISNVLESIIKLQLPMDILVVNDGSNDRTFQLAKLYPVYILSHPTNLGYGSTIQTGYRFASARKYPYVIIFDADGQHDPTYLMNMMEAIKRVNTDVVIGSRFLMESKMEISIFKLIILKFFRMLIYYITGNRITDPTSGFQGLKQRVYESLASSKDFPNDYPDTNFIIEMILKNHKIREIPVNMYNREHGKSIHSGLKPILYVLQIMLSIFVIVIKHKFLQREKKNE